MTRSFTILKYVPTILCGLLVAAWVASEFWAFAAFLPLPSGGRVGVGCTQRMLVFRHDADDDEMRIGLSEHPMVLVRATWRTVWLSEQYQSTWIVVPIPALLTLLLPLAIGPFIRFRYPLWSWFAFMAVVAGELAFYLR